MKRYTLWLLIIFFNFSCENPDKFESFIEQELGLSEEQRSNQRFYMINMNSCSGCLKINNNYLLNSSFNSLNLVFIGGMENGGYFDLVEYKSNNWKIFQVKERDFFPYDIYTHDPLFLEFDEDGHTYFDQNIKVDEFDLLDSLLQM